MDSTQPTWQVGNEQGTDCLYWKVKDVKIACHLQGRHLGLVCGM